ncbi:MAG: F-type H+-transporting ATPase subunit epsilon, partial [Yoonia sp.]
TLRPGVLSVTHSGGVDDYIVVGGFAEITPTGVTVLAERALPNSEVTQEMFDSMVAEAKEAYATAQETFKNEPGPVDDAAKLISDLVAIGGHIGLTANT